uniref:L1 transposable element RRM domain-containing protein n=1 Tax=Erpetoichthys calabaricus TaxID=27687 RepID=A0A8C4TGG9_ERPCA
MNVAPDSTSVTPLPPPPFWSRVCSLLFTWNGRRLRLKQIVLIYDKCNAGVSLLDLELHHWPYKVTIELKKDNKDKETRLFKRFDVNFTGMLEKLVGHIEETNSKLKMLDDHINDVSDQLEDVKQGLTARVETAEQLASNADEKATAVNSECKKLGDRLAALEDGCRRNNIRIEGIPEKRESSSSSPVKFAVELLSKIIGDDFKLDIEIATAYRTKIPSAFKPRPFIVRFERLRRKLDVMALLRRKQEIIFENNLIRIFPDFSPSTAAKRRSYIDIKKLLRIADIKYSLLYPVKLKVEVQDQHYIFLSKEEAEKELKKLFPTLF